VEGANEFNWEVDHRTVPTYGYTVSGPGTPMMIVPGSWKQIVD
jgi:hypothetical protein